MLAVIKWHAINLPCRDESFRAASAPTRSVIKASGEVIKAPFLGGTLGARNNLQGLAHADWIFCPLMALDATLRLASTSGSSGILTSLTREFERDNGDRDRSVQRFDPAAHRHPYRAGEQSSNLLAHPLGLIPHDPR